MGYCMSQRDASFRIKGKNRAKALDAIKALASQEDRMSGGSWSGGVQRERWFSWVTTAEFRDARTLEDAMWAWRWEIEGDEGGDVDSIMFGGEKLGDDTVLLGAIAPYVEPGSYIEMQGEDGSLWRWVFDGRTCQEKSATLTWD